MAVNKVSMNYKEETSLYIGDEKNNINNWYFLISQDNFSDLDDLTDKTRTRWMDKFHRQENDFSFNHLNSSHEISRVLSMYDFEEQYEWKSGNGLRSFLLFVRKQIQEHEKKINLIESKVVENIVASQTVPCYIENGIIYYGKWLYQDSIYEVSGTYSDDEKILLILEFVDKERQKFEKLKNKFSGKKTEELKYERNRIPEEVRIAVWRRDQGRCARCGGRENLEYDHIVPVSKGGGNTERNIELLCQNCNRSKGNRIE